MTPVRFRFEDAPHGVRLAYAGSAQAKSTVILLPCAGSGALIFRDVVQQLPSSWRIVAIDPPARRGLLTAYRIEDLANIYFDALGHLLEGQYYLVGHSLGGLLAFLLATNAERTRFPPSGLVICAIRDPNRVLVESWSSLSDEELTHRLDHIGGVPELFRGRLDEFRAFLEPIRADFRALERYEHRNHLRVTCPMQVVAGRDDHFAPVEYMRPWLNYGTHGTFHVMDGGHFFVYEYAREFAQFLVRDVVGTAT